MTDQPNEKKKVPVIGIDLGTTKSAGAIFDNGVAKIFVNQEGKRTTPSFVAIKEDGELLVGEHAKNQASANTENTAYGIKRLMGRTYYQMEIKNGVFTAKRDAAGNKILDEAVAKMKETMSCEILANEKGDACIKIGGKIMTPQEYSAKILYKLREAAADALGVDISEVTEAIVTVPAYFDDPQKEATKQAGQIAGLNVLRIINEPTAAAVAYGLDKKAGGRYAVYDLGGGTFDVSVLEVTVHEGVGTEVKTLATNGDTFLGGENFDELITEYLIKELNAKNPGLNINPKDPKSKEEHAEAIQRIKEAARDAKQELSSASPEGFTKIKVQYITNKIHLDTTLSRRKMESLIGDLIKGTLEPCRKSLADAGLTINDIDEVILVGQSTRIPMVQDTVAKFFGKTPKKDVALDEIVAMGASIQGAVIAGDLDTIVLTDVIPLSIGIKISGGLMDVLVPANSTIPFEIKKVYSNAVENQPDIGLEVYQGERPKAVDNKLLGKMVLKLPPGSRLKPLKVNEAEIEVTLSIDENGTLSVAAKDLKNGKEIKDTFKANGGLTDEEVARMKQEAVENAEADKIFKETKLTESAAEITLAEVKEDLEDPNFADVPSNLQDEFKAAIQELTTAFDAKSTDGMKTGLQAITDSRSKIRDFFNAAADAAEKEKQQPGNDNDGSSNSASPAAPAA